MTPAGGKEQSLGMISKTRQLRGVCVGALILLALFWTIPASAQVIRKGTDIWHTPGDGSTWATLTIPAGFLCPNWGPWEGTVVLQGVPVVTSPAGAFGNSDTIIVRLADAAFDATGTARTRVVVKALRFRATQPLVTPCGSWDIEVGLDGPQRETDMVIRKNGSTGVTQTSTAKAGKGETSETQVTASAGISGTFQATIAVDSAWTFTNTSTGDVATLPTSNDLTSSNPGIWRDTPCPGVLIVNGVTYVDTNNDGVADTPVPPTSNFFGGINELCERLKHCRDKNIDPVAHCYVLGGPR